jgi:hypothetical protein
VPIQKRPCHVVPAKAGIQKLLKSLDSGPGSSPGQALFRRNDGPRRKSGFLDGIQAIAHNIAEAIRQKELEVINQFAGCLADALASPLSVMMIVDTFKAFC